MPRRLDDNTEHQLGEFLAAQSQVVSRQQMLALGISDAVIRARLSSQLWQDGYPGTYVAHNGPVSYVSRVWSAVLYAGDGAVASFSTSAYLHGLMTMAPGDVHVTVPSGRRVAKQRGLVVHLSNRVYEQAELFSSPPRTTVEETALDLASTKSKPDDVVGVLTNACQRRKTTASRLQLALRLRKKMPHRRLIVEVIAAIADGVESVLEWRYVRDVERAHGLPRGKRQAMRRRDGAREYVDVKYKKYKVLVELDGEVFHVGERRKRDRKRDNAAAVDDYVSLRYGWDDVNVTPCASAAQLAAVFRLRGWRGTLRYCRKCRP